MYSTMPMEHLGMMSIKAYAKTQGIEIATVNGLVAGHSSVQETWSAIENAVRCSGKPGWSAFRASTPFLRCCG
ncbi:methyltransferase domain protein [Mycobacterium ulcerans str. Harvey]|uniref:Methyltransferase domain protein n=1 Tax=Mycobacterium ulcerans str. Harvey TaxID=1299332 RepID=A0ABN0R0C4_MYCUL|nr:methyltransferase domain protein [Mycobacterium ulcerans str. Harvey]